MEIHDFIDTAVLWLKIDLTTDELKLTLAADFFKPGVVLPLHFILPQTLLQTDFSAENPQLQSRSYPTLVPINQSIARR